jgi:membrane-bound metal-dependent hydrolase YbcI (DUF457 family)
MPAVAPDLDTIGHRGFFHSPFFPILLAVSLAAMVAGRRPARLAGGGGMTWRIRNFSSSAIATKAHGIAVML